MKSNKEEVYVNELMPVPQGIYKHISVDVLMRTVFGEIDPVTRALFTVRQLTEIPDGFKSFGERLEHLVVSGDITAEMYKALMAPLRNDISHRYVEEHHFKLLLKHGWLKESDVKAQPSSKYPGYVKITHINPFAAEIARISKQSDAAAFAEKKALFEEFVSEGYRKQYEEYLDSLDLSKKAPTSWHVKDYDIRYGVVLRSMSGELLIYVPPATIDKIMFYGKARGAGDYITPEEQECIHCLKTNQPFQNTLKLFGLQYWQEKLDARIAAQNSGLETLQAELMAKASPEEKILCDLLFRDVGRGLLKDAVLASWDNFRPVLERAGYLEQSEDGVFPTLLLKETKLISLLVRKGLATSAQQAIQQSEPLYAEGEQIYEQLSKTLFLTAVKEDAMHITDHSFRRLKNETLKGLSENIGKMEETAYVSVLSQQDIEMIELDRGVKQVLSALGGTGAVDPLKQAENEMFQPFYGALVQRAEVKELGKPKAAFNVVETVTKNATSRMEQIKKDAAHKQILDAGNRVKTALGKLSSVAKLAAEKIQENESGRGGRA